MIPADVCDSVRDPALQLGLVDARSKLIPCWTSVANPKKSVWFSSSSLTSLGIRKWRETEKGKFRTRWVSEKGLKASVKHSGSWQTQVLPSILYLHDIL